MSNIGIAKASPCNSTTEFQIQAGSEHPINCSVKLDQKDDATGVVINFNIDNQLLTSKIPILTIFFEIEKDQDHQCPENGPQLDTFIGVMDVIVHTGNIQSSVWSYGCSEKEVDVSKTIYMTRFPQDSKNTKSPKLKTYLVPTTSAIINVRVSLVMKNIGIALGESANETLTALFPLVFKYDHTENDTRRVRVHTTRTDLNIAEVKSGCAIVTIQRLDRPFHYSESDVTFKSLWQTMLGRSVIDVDVGHNEGSDTPSPYKNGFFIVILRKRNETMCNHTRYDVSVDGVDDEKIHSERSLFGTSHSLNANGSDVRIKVEIMRMKNAAWFYRTITILGIIIIIVVFLWERLIGIRYPNAAFTGIVRLNRGPVHSVVHDWIDTSDSEMEDVVDGTGDDSACDQKLPTTQHQNETAQKGSYKKIQKMYIVDGKIARDQNKDRSRNGRRNKITSKCLRLSDFASKCDPSLFQHNLHTRSNLYCWIVASCGVFYILPAIQLMFGAQYISTHTGSQDLCYYNFLCRYTITTPLGQIADWNHVFSNFPYVISGLLFMVAVRRRKVRRCGAMVKLYEESRGHMKSGRKLGPQETVVDLLTHNHQIKEKMAEYAQKNVCIEFLNRCGIPEQYGLYYAMGIATIMEGILSLCYHICPTHESFQFDTTFMYILSALVFLKMYQFRHPDLTAKANVMFCVIALLLVTETMSYYIPPFIYSGFFVTAYIVILGIVMVKMYFALYSKSPKLKWEKCVKNRFRCKSLASGERARLILYLMMFALNLLIAVSYIVKALDPKKRSEVSNILLFIGFGNMAGYAGFYVSMKLYYILRSNTKRNAKNMFFGMMPWCREGDNQYSKLVHPESFSRTNVIYFILWVSCAFFSAKFFTTKEKTTEISPSQSRHLNADCSFLSFDQHDLWHFTSAFGLFFTFMWLLTLEDNNTVTHWEKIPVF